MFIVVLQHSVSGDSDSLVCNDMQYTAAREAPGTSAIYDRANRQKIRPFQLKKKMRRGKFKNESKAGFSGGALRALVAR